MSNSSTRYTARFPLPELLERGRDELVKCEVYRGGQLAAPTQAGSTLTVRDRAGAVIVNGAAVTVTASVAQYTIASTVCASLPFDLGWTFEWRLLMGDGITHLFRNDGGLCRARLYPVITDRDVHRRMRALDTSLPAAITDRTSFQDDIDEADIWVQGRLIETGRRPHLIATPSSLRETWLAATVANVLEGIAAQDAGYSELADKWRQRAEEALERATVQFDYDEDGNIDDADTRAPLKHGTIWTC